MNTVLLIEDDEFKANSIKAFMLNQKQFDEVIIVSSLVEAVDAIDEREYSFIVIDMSIPSHPVRVGEGSPKSLLTGGLNVLLELSSLDRSDPCVVITQYPDIEISGQFYSLDKAARQINVQLECSVLACIHYKDGGSWERDLQEVLDSYESVGS